MRGLQRENTELKGRDFDAAGQEMAPVVDVEEEQRGLVDAIRAQMIALVTKKDEENARLTCRVCSLEKEVFIFKFLMVTCVVVFLAMAWVNW